MVSGRAIFHSTERQGGGDEQASCREPSDTAGAASKSVMAVGGARRCDRALCDGPAHFAIDGIKTGTSNRTKEES